MAFFKSLADDPKQAEAHQARYEKERQRHQEYEAQLYDNRHWVAEYIARGWSPIPLETWGINPIKPDWRETRLGVDDIDSEFSPGERRNIGILLGAPSNGLVHVNLDGDLDTDLAIHLAGHFLPQTGVVFGKASREDCHRIYRVPNPGEPVKLSADRFGTIVDLRSTGQQSLFPNSVDQDGERLVFRSFNQPAVVTWEELQLGVVKLAFATMLIKGWTLHTRLALPE